uniref:Uncharacterized protein n=1 Tax=viral metagenome TaxID=1070528 RepID=A0A6M3K1G5_9ZZZZ
MKLTREEYLKKCMELLDFFGIDYSKDVINLTDGGNSCIANPSSEFYELFGGHSINSIAEFVAKELGKETIWLEY